MDLHSVKRDLLQCQKRPTTVSKETYYSVKRDLLHCTHTNYGLAQEVPLSFVTRLEKNESKGVFSLRLCHTARNFDFETPDVSVRDEWHSAISAALSR